MKQLLISLLAIAFIASCGTETDAEYPKVFGTWQVNSETDAEWIGTKSKPVVQQADTVELTTPQGQHISIIKSNDPNAKAGWVDFTYIDSTNFNWQQVDLGSTEIQFPDYAPPNTGINFGVGGRELGVGENRLHFTLDLHYKCGYDFERNPFVWLHFYQNDGNPFRHYKIKVDGFSDAISNVGC